MALYVFSSPAFAESYQLLESRDRILYADLSATGVDARTTTVDAKKQRDVGEIKVIMYMTDWCPYCKKAREYLVSTGVNLIEYNIDKDSDRRQEMRIKSGSGAVPVIDIEGIIIRGYNLRAINSAIMSRRNSVKTGDVF
ncbi:MAG: glutaredoxin domain-containing protein [Nitrospirota bacterium]|nr:glutaredoxin domain-containing protein [Nitrospirota bacterium]